MRMTQPVDYRSLLSARVFAVEWPIITEGRHRGTPLGPHGSADRTLPLATCLAPAESDH
jgi:hypothetical protein